MENKDKNPELPCPACGSNDWWWQQSKWNPRGGWLCNVCHPNPDNELTEVKQ